MPMKPGKVGVEEGIETVHRIRITLSSKNVKNLEKGELPAFVIWKWFPSEILLNAGEKYTHLKAWSMIHHSHAF